MAASVIFAAQNALRGVFLFLLIDLVAYVPVLFAHMFHLCRIHVKNAKACKRNEEDDDDTSVYGFSLVFDLVIFVNFEAFS